MSARTALLIVDVQNDFCPGGALPVPRGDEVVPALNRAIIQARQRGWPILASRDWHPPKTSHFKTFGGQWPAHCVQGTRGAELHPALKLPNDAIIISKGMRPDEDSYSAFDGTDDAGTTLANRLRQLGVTELCLAGLATDYCVKHTTLDALQQGFRVHVLEEAVRSVDLSAGDGARALEEMRARGAVIVHDLE